MIEDDFWYPLEYPRSCLECGEPAPAGFAICDKCVPTVYRELGKLIVDALEKEEEKDEDDTTGIC